MDLQPQQPSAGSEQKHLELFVAGRGVGRMGAGNHCGVHLRSLNQKCRDLDVPATTMTTKFETKNDNIEPRWYRAPNRER